MPEISFNGEKRSVEDSSTVDELLKREGVQPKGLIVLLDGDVLDGDVWASTKLRDGAALDLLRLAGGG
jgi:thiamine biosynthesis protein ThiS